MSRVLALRLAGFVLGVAWVSIDVIKGELNVARAVLMSIIFIQGLAALADLWRERSKS